MDRKGPRNDGGPPRRKTQLQAGTTSSGVNLSWSSIARMVNKKELQRHKAEKASAKCCASMPVLPRPGGASAPNGSRRSSGDNDGEVLHVSSSTPVLPQLVEAPTPSPELGPKPRKTPEELPETLPAKGRMPEELIPLMPEEVDDQDEPQHILMVAPWKKHASRPPRKKLVRQNAMTFRSLDSMEDVDLTAETVQLPGFVEPRPPSSNSRSSAELEQCEEHSNHSTNSARLRALGEKHWAKLKNVSHAAHLAKQDHGCESTMLDTMQQWRKYCRKTDQISTALPGRASRLQGGTEAHAKSIRTLDTELQLDRDRLRLMIQQGVHKSKNGLKLTVRHVQPDIDHEALCRRRLETLEKVDTKGKRIQQALNDSARARKDLKTCVEALRDTMNGNPEGGRKKIKRKDPSKTSWNDRMDAIRKKLEEFILTGTVED